ncbi:MAG: CAP domain-containing protein [Bdellovibrionales bacterium]
MIQALVAGYAVILAIGCAPPRSASISQKSGYAPPLPQGQISTIVSMDTSSAYSSECRDFSGDGKEKLREDTCKMVNQTRSQYSTTLLILDARLSAVAQARAQDMATKNYFSHTAPDGTTYLEVMLANGLDAGLSGENIAQAPGEASLAMGAWLKSPGHLSNIVKSGYRRLGVGFSGGYWVQVFAD